jgi:predicted DNA-binding protein
MARAETMVQLTDELRQRLDEEAGRRGVSRSAVIREALTAYLAESSEAAIARKIVEGYTRIPQSTPDGWGDLDALHEASTREMLQRLDEEESGAAGRER